MVRGKRRKIIIIVSIVSVLLAGGALGYWLLFGRSASPLPKELVAQATFPVYYPKELPEGYALKPNSASGDDTTVFYTLVDASGQQAVTVTMQATPPGFDAAKMMGSTPIPTTITPNGTLYNLSAEGSSKFMLSTGKSLLFITSPKSIEGKIINTLVNNLVKVV